VAANPWLARRVLNYAHQGGAREGPSSTLYALRRARAAGAHALELDVHATADGHLVVCHDATVDRTTDGTGAIAALTLAEIQTLDNAYWWVPGEVVAEGRPAADYPFRGRAPSDREFRIATLEEVLQAFPGVFLNLDIKQTAPQVEPYEAALAGLLRAHGRAADVIVASFWDAATDAFRAVAPEITTSAGTLATAEFHRTVQTGEPAPPAVTCHQALQVPPAVGEIVVVDEPFVTAAHAAGLAVHVWTIDEADEMARLVALGVDGIMSDRPSVLAGVLAEQGAAWTEDQA
jgi:glycerophosphoryl diester phosphodiesterase